jgi:beta-lactamase class A
MKPLYDILISLALLISLTSGALGASEYPPLRDRFDVKLQRGLEKAVINLGLWKAVQHQKLGLALVDMTNPHRPRVAAVNGDEMIYAASLPKIAILLGAFVLVERGEMHLDRATRRTLTDMIRVSSNQAATAMLHRIGKPRLARILQSERFQLYDPAVNGGLWVGKDYGKRPAWKRDPLHHLSHGATALQVARFYYLLETQQLMAPELCQEMKRMLSKPALRHKFVKGLESRPGATIYRKSGSWRRWHADSALVERGHRKYIAVALAESRHGGTWLTKLIVAMDELIARSWPRLALKGESAQ